MSVWETSTGASDDWFTPPHIFEALGERFDLDVAAPPTGPLHVPARQWLDRAGLETAWEGFVWMNAPFGGRNGLVPWLDRFFDHGHGIALAPDRTSAPWWQEAARRADAHLQIAGKVKFIRPDGTIGASPSSGTTLFAAGRRALLAIHRAQIMGLGTAFARLR